jgi:hypothetical protein
MMTNSGRRRLGITGRLERGLAAAAARSQPDTSTVENRPPGSFAQKESRRFAGFDRTNTAAEKYRKLFFRTLRSRSDRSIMALVGPQLVKRLWSFPR